MGERYLTSVRLLAECLQGFERYSGESVREYGLTHAQFDIIATLGNTDGMSYKQLGERTLITKGTLPGVIERLEQKGIVLRERCSGDQRSFNEMDGALNKLRERISHAGRPSLLSLQQKEES